MEQGRDDAGLTAAVRDLRSRAHTVEDAAALVALLRRLIEPDITVTSGDAEAIDACHRRITDPFRRHHRGVPDLQHPAHRDHGLAEAQGRPAGLRSGTAKPARPSAGEWSRDGSGTAVTLRLAPYAAPYIVIGEEVDDGLSPLPVETTGAPAATLPVTGTWLFKPLPGEDPNLRAYGHVPAIVAVPVFRTTQIYDEDPMRFEPEVWEQFPQPDFDDSGWDLVHCARRPLLYDDWYGSRIFRTVIPPGADAIKLPIPINCQYVLYVDGIRLRVATERTDMESGWLDIPIGEGSRACWRSSAARRRTSTASRARSSSAAGPGRSSRARGWTRGCGGTAGSPSTTRKWSCRTPAGRRVILDLGEVKESAELWVNARRVGAQIWPPYSFDITRYVVAGRNDVRVIASNLLSNHMFWAEAGRRDKPGQVSPSGLLGPVRIDLFDAARPQEAS